MFSRWASVFATTALATTAFVAAAQMTSGCSGGDDKPVGDAAADAPASNDEGPAPVTTTTNDAAADAAAGSLTGTIKDEAGVPVVGAKVEVSGAAAAVYSDSSGKFTLPQLPPGPCTVKVTRNWFKPFESSTTIADAGPTTLDVTFLQVPMKVDPADRALADSYAKTFDWTKNSISVSIVPRPTRRDFDDAVYFHNPALFKDRSAEPALVPAAPPAIAGGVAQNFTFKVIGPNAGQEAFDGTTIADSLAGTPFGGIEPADYMMWDPMIKWLGEWDEAKAAKLQAVAVAVRQQNWGGNALLPQDVEKVYVDGQGALWVKVVFQKFVQLGAGISDDDGDGYKEIYARVAAVHVSPGVVTKLTEEYGKKLFDTHGLGDELSQSLRDLYSRTNAQVERYIGQPFVIPDVGTVMYPFVVLKHAGKQQNVILVAPSP